ncbi:MAG TPA: S9 family peptidase [Allosphingosinicella sp.]|jgi:dipeptidyl aminopeptidase/acylaminoacyl peptidase
MLKHFAALLLLSAAAAPAALAAPAEGPSRTFEGRDLFSLEVAADPQISPDGSRIAYVRRSGDIMTDRMRNTIWPIDTRSGEQMPLVAGTGGHGSPRWSPDGKRLAYVSSAEGANPQLFVRWMETGEAVRITGLPQSPSSIAWSPDGKRIAYSMFVPDEGVKLGSAPPKPEGAKWAEPLEVHTAINYRSDSDGYAKPGYTHLFLVSADGGAPRQLTVGARNHDGPVSWSRDGRTLLFSGNRRADWEREPADSEVYAVDVHSGAFRTLTDRRGPDSEPVMSPDGGMIAYVGYEDKRLNYHNSRLTVMNADGSNPRVLTANLDRSVEAPSWAADGRSIFVQYEDQGRVKVARVGLDGSIRTVTDDLSGSGLDRPYTGGSYTVARDGSLAITAGSATRPADVALVRGGGEPRMLTRLNADLLGAKRMGEVRKIPVTAFDNRPIDAWLTLPPTWSEGTRVPLILEIHGGPVAAYGPHFATDNQLYAASGYAVLSVNPRGSSSYGAEFAQLIHHDYPSRDYDDLMSAVDAAIAQGFVDPDKLFVTGGSGGGVLTSWIVGKTDRFKAAATQKPVINWVSEALTMDNTLFTSHYWFAKKPWEDQETYWKYSPLSLVGNVKTPTLVVVGSEDYRTPVSESEQYYAALQIQGVPTALVKVPGASHGGIAARPSQAAAKAAAILAWFEKYKNGAPAAAEGK